MRRTSATFLRRGGGWGEVGRDDSVSVQELILMYLCVGAWLLVLSGGREGAHSRKRSSNTQNGVCGLTSDAMEDAFSVGADAHRRRGLA